MCNFEYQNNISIFFFRFSIIGLSLLFILLSYGKKLHLRVYSFNALIIPILRIACTITFHYSCTWTRCGTRLYQFLIFATFLTFFDIRIIAEYHFLIIKTHFLCSFVYQNSYFDFRYSGITVIHVIMVKIRKKCKEQESIQSSTTSDPEHRMGK